VNITETKIERERERKGERRRDSGTQSEPGHEGSGLQYSICAVLKNVR